MLAGMLIERINKIAHDMSVNGLLPEVSDVSEGYIPYYWASVSEKSEAD